MRDCQYCLNQRNLINAYGVEARCPACKEVLMRQPTAPIALRMAQEAAEKFVRDLGKRKKAV